MQEGLPRALIEGMSRACPAIGSTTAGIPELLENEVIFKRGNVKELKKVLERTIEGNLLRMAIRNFRKAKEYELSALNARRREIYNQYRRNVIGDN